ncbi:MAG: hypothetical protein IPI67_04470 [Myxococcales bacterium]|nr:hypothetical protein [Myxococcales bacterium]
MAVATSSSWSRWLRPVVLGIVAMLTTVVGCSDTSSSKGDEAWDDYGIPGPFGLEGPTGKADNAGIPGIATDWDNSETQVWAVTNQWEDRSTPAAKKAGMAWGEDSGLNWDEKYVAWVAAMKKIPAKSYGQTFELLTPFGKTVPAPSLECAEVAIFSRFTFASWYGLPFYMTTTDEQGTRVYFGHFGARTATARYRNTPLFKSYYKDYSNMAPAEYQAAWPKDDKLRQRIVHGGTDSSDVIVPGGSTGLYFDEIFLNKRVGYLGLLLLDYFGSMNLANSRNTYNLKPEALRTGDVLVERWQANGIGHTLLVKSVTPLEGGRKDAQLASGSMPRRQPKWEDAITSKQTFTNEYTGGEGYVQFGGGLKRWRVAKVWNGKWTNTWMKADESSWINDTDTEKLKIRPTQFQSLLGEVPPEQLRDALVAIIADARTHLSNYPASCSAREKRENAFRSLYQLNQDKFGISNAQTDSQYRKIEDYAFAELVYDKSKTCCWNSTTADMYKIIMDYEASLQTNACAAPVVFMSSGGGNYQAFADFAASTGRAAQWKAWSEDEPCAQKNVDADTEGNHSWVPFCELTGTGGGGGTGGAGGAAGSGGSGNAGNTGGSGNTGNTGGSSGSCVGHCGSGTPVPGSSPSCYCDSYCTQNNDCCADKVAACG